MDIRSEIKKFLNGGMPQSTVEEKELGLNKLHAAFGSTEQLTSD